MSRARFSALAALAVAVALLLFSLPPATIPLPATEGIPEPVRGALHVHTRRSDGSGTVDQIAAAAARAGLGFVIMTDHGNAARTADPPSYRSGVLCIDAVEISTDDGHLVALGLPRELPHLLGGEGRDVIEDIARFGGLSVAAHPGSSKPSLRWTDWSAPFDGLEWLNADSEWRDESATSLVRALFTYPFRKVETVAALLDRPTDVLRGWDELTRGRRVVALAATDAHASVGLGRQANPYGDRSPLALPGYEHVFRAFSIAVPRLHLTGDPEVDAPALMAEVRNGRIYSSVDGLAAPARMVLTATSGAVTAGPGDELPLSGPVDFDVRTTAPATARVELLRNGAVVASAAGGVLRHDAGVLPGTYRVEVFLDRAPGSPEVPWLLSNPVYVGTVADTSTPDEAADVDTLVRYADGPLERGWGLEKSARSEGVLDVVRNPSGGTRLSLRYALGGSLAEGPYVALVMPAGPVAEYDRLMFSARASGPMRLWVQLRIRTPGGDQYWRRSVYLEDARKSVAVRFDDMRPLGNRGREQPLLAQADTIMFVVDHVHTALGDGGRIWFDDITYGRRR